MNQALLPSPPPSPTLVEDLESGISDAYQGDEELTTGVVGAGVQLVSEVSSAFGDFFKSLAGTLAANPKIVTYAVYAVTAYGAYAFYKKYRNGNEE